MRRIRIRLAAVGVTACAVLALASVAQAAVPVPIKGTLTGPSVLNLSTGTFVQTLTGVESHLGRVTDHVTGTVVFTGPNSFDSSGTGVVTAANGDELFGSFTGSGTIDPAGRSSGSAIVTITGGTGRFSGASGSQTLSFSTTPGTTSGTTVTQTFTDMLSGRIIY
jgi:hypothetical protein